MAEKSGDEKLLYCSFCGKSQHEVRKLIAGPSVFICDECVDLCLDIIREDVQKEGDKEVGERLPTPLEIRDSLNQYVIGQDPAKRALAVEHGAKEVTRRELGRIIIAKRRLDIKATE